MTDNRDLATTQPAPTSPVAIPVDQQMAMMREAMTNPNVNPANAREMLSLFREMQNDARQAEFNRDKGEAIRAMPAMFKRGKSDKHSYAKFEDMHRAAMPVLAAHGLTLDFRIGSEGNNITVQPILRHDNGYIEEGGVMKGPADTGPGRSAIQSIGSASSYLKRYAMKAMLNLIEDGEDNDGAVGRDDYKLNDRQEGLVVDAQAAAERGEYVAWYGKLNTKDKAFLVTSGHHARLGAGTALPDAGSRPGDAPAQRADPPAVKKLDPAQQQRVHDTNTPDGWTADYCDRMAAAPDIAMIDRLKASGKNGLAKLADMPDQRLFERCDSAEMDARERVKSGGMI